MKYFRTFLLALESEFASRVNVLGWFLVGAIPSAVLILVWFAILGERESVGGFTKGDFIIYYSFMTFGWYVVGGVFAGNIGRSIKNGEISVALQKPYNPVLGHALEEQAWKVLAIAMTLPFLGAIMYAFRDSIQISLPWEQWPILAVSLALGALNFALVEAIVGVSAFWIIDMYPVSRVKDILLSLFGGLLVPLALMPSWILSVADLLPFKYMFYVPVSILLSMGENASRDVLLQGAYVVVLFMLFKLVWGLGIRKYESVGT